MARSLNGFGFRSYRGPSGCTEPCITVGAPEGLSLKQLPARYTALPEF